MIAILLCVLVIFGVKWYWDRCGEVRIVSLWVYPVKSCQGIRCKRLLVSNDGSLRYDREWAILDTRTNKILTGRDKPCLVRIQPSISTTLVLTFPDGCSVSTMDNASLAFDTELWQVPCTGIDQGDDVSNALSAYLEEPCGTIRLIRMKRCDRRLSDCLKYGPLAGSEELTRFSDWSPITLISTATVRAIRSSDLDERWFRPNLVVDAKTPFIEETWDRFKIQSNGTFQSFQVLKRCSRCVELCVNPATGRFTRGFEPLKTLRRLRGGFYDFLPLSSSFYKLEAFAAVNVIMKPRSEAFPIVVGSKVTAISLNEIGNSDGGLERARGALRPQRLAQHQHRRELLVLGLDRGALGRRGAWFAEAIDER